MGTSRSSSGSPSNVPLVPPWVPDVPDDDADAEKRPDSEEGDESSDDEASEDKRETIAPPRRFANTRRTLGKYADSGSRDQLRRGVGRYVGGLGGPQVAARRFGKTASTAKALYAALGGASSAKDAERFELDRALIAGRGARRIIDAIIELVCPPDGSQDADASRDSINDALSELLRRFPGADLFDLSEEQRLYVIEIFISRDVYRRFYLDVGNAIKNKAKSAPLAVKRLRQVLEYIRETVAAAFRNVLNARERIRSSTLARIVTTSLRDAFIVFAEYAE